MASIWTEDWTSPPINCDQLELWRFYCVYFNDCNLTAPGFFVRRWLQMYGLPRMCATDRFYQRALDIYMLPGADRRRP